MAILLSKMYLPMVHNTHRLIINSMNPDLFQNCFHNIKKCSIFHSVCLRFQKANSQHQEFNCLLNNFILRLLCFNSLGFLIVILLKLHLGNILVNRKNIDRLMNKSNLFATFKIKKIQRNGIKYCYLCPIILNNVTYLRIK